MSIVQDDTITIFYTDRDNSPEPPSDTSSVYSYPVEHEFWEIEDVDDAQASNARWKHVYMQLHMQSVENPPSQRIAKMQQNRPLNRCVVYNKSRLANMIPVFPKSMFSSILYK